MADLRAIAVRYGGKLSGRECLIPTPGHSRQDRGTAIRLAPGAPDGVLVTCYNGGRLEALAVKDMLRRDGFLPERDGARRELTAAEKLAIKRAEAERARERAEAQAKAAELARQILASAQSADPMHPYLQSKRISSEGLYQTADGWLIVPMQDDNGVIRSIQRISPKGTPGDWPKFYLKGGRTKGLFWQVGEVGDRLVIGEGVATVAAVRRATGLPVIAAMTAGNLPEVAILLRAKLPTDTTITIAADDDEAGHKAARLAASQTGARIALPQGSCRHA